ncbi:hypothetical protein H0A61_00704 [Koleobacter methoxysyntrophicus]|uniref:Uncharacterized protein n=1 Tax=Koleobacter methoxysyntrophicus TaxID=2751313 RepID=A0A8A0RKH5_9FIRM|nr:hypothetical protein [Koleobacter methoxysyntrophicus]QSQ08382.1 hypothetical protein H0A61_00704 [Koleobacter methoxysyntrophicus]
MLVYAINKHGRLLMPYKPSKARKLLCINSHDGLFIFKCGFSFDNGTLVYTYVYCSIAALVLLMGLMKQAAQAF